MTNIKTYRETNKMRELIDDNPFLLLIMRRFGISLGFGDNSIAKVCAMQGVHCRTFLSVANFISGKPYDTTDISLRALMDCLRSAHTYFLNFFLPNIRKKLIEVLGYEDDNNLSMLLLRYFDNYVEEVSNHMDFENDTVFKYVEALLDNNILEKLNISVFSAKHVGMSSKLKELKDIIIRYFPQKNSDLLNEILLQLIECEHDLKSHCQIEDRLFIPEVKKLELSVHDKFTRRKQTSEQPVSMESKIEMLSEREQEIVKCVAKGMANKEIADALCLSIHTVTTHRRNLCNKLGIHSPAGLTIFCIINNLVNIDEIKAIK
jgi:regulator of cell morphogenesis and NO signaling